MKKELVYIINRDTKTLVEILPAMIWHSMDYDECVTLLRLENGFMDWTNTSSPDWKNTVMAKLTK